MTLHVSNKMLRVAAIAAATALALSACGKSEDKAGQQGGAAAGQQAPAPEVRVVTVHPQQVTISTDLPGRLESFRSAGVRAQVGGIIKKRLFQEGSYVKAGQPLYQLDDATYVASLESARAQLATAEASLAKANADLTRYKPLVAADAISKQDYDAAVASKRSGEASVKSAKAAIKSAQINVGYSRITAPISGYIGQSKVSEGSLVGANDSTVLATIQQTNPMYVNLTQSATDVMRLKQDIADGKMQAVNGAVEVSILLENGTEYPHKGRLLFADPTVNETTGRYCRLVRRSAAGRYPRHERYGPYCERQRRNGAARGNRCPAAGNQLDYHRGSERRRQSRRGRNQYRRHVGCEESNAERMDAV